MITIQTAKNIVQLVVAVGTYKIVGQVIDNNTPTPTKFADKLTTKAGKFAIAGAVSARTERYTSASIDQIVRGVHEIQKAFEESK